MGTNTAQRGSTGIASATTTPTHHRTRSRMDEVLQAASSNGLQSAASNASPSRGKKRKNRHSSAAEPPTDDSEAFVPVDELTDEDLLNQIISSLSLPQREISVVNSHSNQRYSSPEQAFAKLAGQNWTYYLNETQIIIGRGEKDSSVDVDLGPGKMVSRRHAHIAYENDDWWITVDGRNGLKADGASVQIHEKITLKNGTILEIGGVQMMFVLPISLTRSQLLTIHARQHSLPPPFPTPSPQKRPATLSRRDSSPVHSYPQGVRIVQGPRIITSPNGSDYPSHGEIDLALDSSKEIKPQFSYAMMIAQAILSVPERKMQLSKIYEFIMSRYAFYRYTKSGWQNSIRHNLSLNKAFVKVPRRTDEPGKGMKWQIADEFLEEFIAKVNRTMTPRGPKTFASPGQQQKQTSSPPDHSSPLRARYPSDQRTPTRDYMMSPTSLQRGSAPPPETPERGSTQRQFMPMSSPAPFYRYSSISTPGTTHERSSPPSSGAIDLAETLVEFSSPTKLREPFTSRRVSTPSEQDDSPSRPIRNGIKSSLGDLQGVDLLRGFEKISSSWRDDSSPIKSEHYETTRDVEMRIREYDENGFGKDLKKMKDSVMMKDTERVNGNGYNGKITPPEEMDSQMTEVRSE